MAERNTLESKTKDDPIIETLDTDCENVESLKNLDDMNTTRCGKYVKNCALQKYLTSDHNARKNCEIKKITCENINIFCFSLFFFFLFPHS